MNEVWVACCGILLSPEVEGTAIPFKSKSQARYFFAAESRGDLPKGTAERWAHHTKSIKALPDHVDGKKEKKASLIEELAAEAAVFLKSSAAVFPRQSTDSSPLGEVPHKQHDEAAEHAAPHHEQVSPPPHAGGGPHHASIAPHQPHDSSHLMHEVEQDMRKPVHHPPGQHLAHRVVALMRKTEQDMRQQGHHKQADLSAGERKALPKSDFARPQHAKTPEGKASSGSYPIPDAKHARSALGFAAMHHGKDSATYRQVAAKVHAKFGSDGELAFLRPLVIGALAQRYKEAMCREVVSHLDNVAGHMPLEKQAHVRALQHELTLGKPLAESIKVAYPHLSGEQRGFLASQLVRSVLSSLEKQAFGGMGVPTKSPAISLPASGGVGPVAPKPQSFGSMATNGVSLGASGGSDATMGKVASERDGGGRYQGMRDVQGSSTGSSISHSKHLPAWMGKGHAAGGGKAKGALQGEHHRQPMSHGQHVPIVHNMLPHETAKKMMASPSCK